jgi:hypothetical protein
MMANGSVNLHQTGFHHRMSALTTYSNDDAQGAGRELKRYLIGSSYEWHPEVGRANVE